MVRISLSTTLSFKARTEKEVREYLKKYDIDEKITSQVIANP